jgi:hypothetical protein
MAQAIRQPLQLPTAGTATYVPQAGLTAGTSYGAGATYGAGTTFGAGTTYGTGYGTGATYSTGTSYGTGSALGSGTAYGTTYTSGALPQSTYGGGTYTGAVQQTAYTSNVAHPVVSQQYVQGTQTYVQPQTVAVPAIHQTVQIPTAQHHVSYI